MINQYYLALTIHKRINLKSYFPSNFLLGAYINSNHMLFIDFISFPLFTRLEKTQHTWKSIHQSFGLDCFKKSKQ